VFAWYGAIVAWSEYITRSSYDAIVDILGKARLSVDAAGVLDSMRLWMVLLFLLIAYVPAYYRKGQWCRERLGVPDLGVDLLVWWALSATVLYAFGYSLKTYIAVWSVVIFLAVCVERLFCWVMEATSARLPREWFLGRWVEVAFEVYSKVHRRPASTFLGIAMLLYCITAILLVSGNEYGAEEAGVWAYVFCGMGVSIWLWEVVCGGPAGANRDNPGQE
jgi:hypothetical protein